MEPQKSLERGPHFQLFNNSFIQYCSKVKETGSSERWKGCGWSAGANIKKIVDELLDCSSEESPEIYFSIKQIAPQVGISKLPVHRILKKCKFESIQTCFNTSDERFLSSKKN